MKLMLTMDQRMESLGIGKNGLIAFYLTFRPLKNAF